MSSILFINIKKLVNVREQYSLLYGKDLAKLPCIENAYLLVEDDTIVKYGRMEELGLLQSGQQTVSVAGQFVLPAWCDSHTHIVFAASREEEFIDKIKGLSYAEIAQRGGGILNSARKLNNMSETELFNLAWKRLEELRKLRTGSIEI